MFGPQQPTGGGQVCSLAYELTATWCWQTFTSMTEWTFFLACGIPVDDSTANIAVVRIIISLVA